MKNSEYVGKLMLKLMIKKILPSYKISERKEDSKWSM